jgi:hypothetical protein
VARPRKSSRFQRAVEATTGISRAYKPGIQALEPPDKPRLEHKELATGSVFLDDALKKAHPNANRWDYGIGLSDGEHAEVVLWLEVHHSASGQADLVIKKLEWLRHWLSTSAPELDLLQKKFVWLLSNVETNPNDRKRRNSLAEHHGLVRRQGTLRLREFA